MLRRILAIWLPVIAIAATSALATPTTASADVVACPAIYPRPAYCDRPINVGYQTANLNHVGWVYLNLNYCPQNAMCTAEYRSSTQAWSWNGTSWSQRSLNGGWVYVYPYTGSWRWAWTQSSGWVAISGHRFEIR